MTDGRCALMRVASRAWSRLSVWTVRVLGAGRNSKVTGGIRRDLAVSSLHVIRGPFLFSLPFYFKKI